MGIDQQLFEGTDIRLGAIDQEKDAEIEAGWTQDLNLMRACSLRPAMPFTPTQMKKRYENFEKEMDEGQRLYHFAIRSRQDERLVGFARLQNIEWNNSVGEVLLAIGEEAERGKGHGSQALSLLMRFAFEELNLFRLSAAVGEDNPAALKFFQKHGFIEEVRRRQSLERDGRTWDLIHLGILRQEWLDVKGKG